MNSIECFEKGPKRRDIDYYDRNNYVCLHVNRFSKKNRKNLFFLGKSKI